MKFTFADVEKVHRKYLYLDHDPDLLRIVMATVIANRFPGVSVWITLVGPSGSGKTAVVKGLMGAGGCFFTSAVTPASFASGSTGSSFLDDADGKVWVMTDFSTLSKMPNEAKSQVFGIMRDVYDGRYERRTGRSPLPITWEGKIGFIGCTTALAAHEDISEGQELGERMLIIRMKKSNESVDAIASAAFDSDDTGDMKADLEAVTGRFLDGFKLPKVELPSFVKSETLKLSKFIASARSGVKRDRYTKEVTFPAEEMREAPNRVIKQMRMMTMGLLAIGTEEDAIKRILTRIAMDCIPADRLRTIRAIADGLVLTSKLALAVSVSQAVALRTVEDLQLLGLVSKLDNRGIRLVPAVEALFKTANPDAEDAADEGEDE
ncbi:MAG: hypothetical protein AABY46_04035 [Nitrospirota bacterium]